MRPSPIRSRRQRAGWVFLTPALLVLGAIIIYPILRTILISFERVEPDAGRFRTTWIGLDNYRTFFRFDDPALRAALRNTAIFVVGEVVLVVGIALLFALLLNHRFGRKGAFRAMLLVPWALAPVASAVLWQWIYHGNYGVLNAVLKELGLIDRNRIWLGEPGLALPMLLLADVWKSVPFIALLLFAGLQNIPAYLYRAARLDGATLWQRFRFVTLPGLRTPLALAVILQTIWAFKIFDMVFVLTKGGPADRTLMLNFFAYRVTFNFLDFGYGAAIANLFFLLMLGLAILFIRVLKPGAPRSRMAKA